MAAFPTIDPRALALAPLRLFAVGEVVELAVPAGAGVDGAALALDRTPSLEALDGVAAVAEVEVSDDGVTWALRLQVLIPGGVVLDKDGRIITQSLRRFRWPGVTVDGVRTPEPSAYVRARLTALQAFSSRFALVAEVDPPGPLARRA